MADNEHTSSSLGDSEKLAVQHPVTPPIPAVGQPSEDGGEVTPAVGSKEPWNVLKQQPSGSQLAGHPQELPEEPATLTREPGALAGDAEVLAGEAADKQVAMKLFAPNRAGDISRSGMFVALGLSLAWMNPHVTHVAESGGARPVLGEDALAEGVNLDLEGCGMSRTLKPSVEATDPAEQGAESHSSLTA